MLSPRQTVCPASAHQCSASLPVVRLQQASRSRRQALPVSAQASRLPAVETAVKVEQGYTYADVRTPEEFIAGRPPGAVNIPFMLRTPEGMQPNPEFLQAWKETFPDPTSPIVVGCKSGNRSARACAVLVQEEYADLVDNACGYDGWVAAGLPVEK